MLGAILPEARKKHLIRHLVFLLAMGVSVCAAAPARQPAGCGHSHKLPPLKLSHQQKELLQRPISKPLAALDYYRLLPGRYFSFLPQDPQRRVSYIDTATLSDDYLSASHWFECDRGGFSVKIRVFKTRDGDLVAIDSSQDPPSVLFKRNENQSGLNSVTIKRPTFWRYAGRWRPQPKDLLPALTLEYILDQYRNRFKAHRSHPDEGKFIYLHYRLPRSGDRVDVVGSENFMAADATWAQFRLANGTFHKE